MTGVGGGVVLLSGLLLVVPATAAIPLHGAVQFSAGLSRLVAFRGAVIWPIVWVFLFGMLPGAILGAMSLGWLQKVNPSFVLILIACFILQTVFLQPPSTASAGTQDVHRGGLFGLGFLCGLLGMFVGSTGPIVSGWLLRHGIVKDAHIGSKSVMQGSAHFVKIPLFMWGLDFDFRPYLAPLVLMVCGVIIGTVLGKKLLTKLSSGGFNLIVKGLLTVIALRLLYTEVPTLFTS